MKQEFVIDQGVLRQYCGDAACVVVPDGIQEIGHDAFRDNQALKQVVIPAGVRKIGSQAFYGCEKLERAELPQGVEQIGYSAFERCCSLQQMVLPEGLRLLDRMAFLDCVQLAEIDFPDSLCTVGRDGLRGTAWLEQHPEGVVYAGKLALFAKGTVTDVVLRSDTIKICVDAFRNCSSLIGVQLPDGLEQIEARAFQNCRKLKQITIPASVIGIGDRAFDECQKLQIQLESRQVSLGRGCFADTASVRFTGMDPAKLPETVRQSAVLAFVDDVYNDIPLEDGFYKSCLAYIRSRRKLLYSAAVQHWTLLHFMMGEKILSSEDADSILDILLTEQQTEAAAALIQYKQKLDAADEDWDAGWEDLTLDWDLSEVEKSPDEVAREWGLKKNRDGTVMLLQYRGKDTAVQVPSQVGGQMITLLGPAVCSPQRYGIKRETAMQRRRITSVEIAEGILKIGNQAFADCESLLRATLPESIVQIGYEAFCGCKKLQEIEIPQSVKVIGRGAFANCSSLQRVVLPKGVKLEEDVFAGCSSALQIEDGVTE